MENIKLICLDLDGTTLQDISSISEKNIESIRKAYYSGINIALATGRIFVHGMYFSKLLNIPTYIVGNNGTYVYDVENSIEVYSSYLGCDDLLKIHKIVEQNNFSGYYCTIDKVYIHNLTEFEHNEHEKGEYAMKEIVIEDKNLWNKLFEDNKENICKVVVTSEESIKLENLTKDLKNTGEFEVEYSWINTVEILKKGEGKGQGIRSLKEYLNINSNDVMCIGDSENDISMFKECGYKVAMENAIDKLKVMADYVTLSVTNDGVSYAIEKLLNER